MLKIMPPAIRTLQSRHNERTHKFSNHARVAILGHAAARVNSVVTCKHHRGHVSLCVCLVPGLLLLLMISMAVAISLNMQFVAPHGGRQPTCDLKKPCPATSLHRRAAAGVVILMDSHI